MEVRQGVWQVQAPEELMKELDGWRAQARLLQFTFDRELASVYGADLIGPGSFRLNSILSALRRRASLSCAHIPHHFFHEPGIRRKVLTSFGFGERAYVLTNTYRFSQYLELVILAEAKGLQKKESLHTLVVNLSSGELIRFSFPSHLLQAGGVPDELLEKRRCSLKQAYRKAALHLARLFAQEDQTWAEEALEQIVSEEDKLKAFFQGNTASPEYQAKSNELKRRLQPLLTLNVLRGALLFIPLYCYRLVVVNPEGKERIKTVTFDPIANNCTLD